MYNKQQALQIITQLTEQFHEHIDTYKKGNFNETQTRTDYINPFFEALGWDVNNREGRAETYRDVIHEDKLKIDGKTKAPDYCFTIYGQRKFFVEAKKPSIVIKDDKDPAYQVRRYGWNAKLPVSIVTDFEEFAIYDCTQKPNPNDRAAIARIKYLTYKDYVTEFDFLWDTFAKERILKGSFDKFVQHSPNRKGTTEVDKDFLQSLDTWRDYLAKGLLQSNKQLTQDQLNFALQQTLDRIIFLRIAEDRGIEPYQQLRKAVSKGNAYANLIQVFIAADAKYNSGLFNFTKDTLTPTLKLENKVLKIIVEEMYPPACPYEFSIIPVEILGNAYEQFLGKTIQILPGKRIAIEQKPEVRKAGGVYYTPQYIVQYIVEHTIGKLLTNKTPTQIAHLSICDPACGSGSFLLGAYQFLLQWYLHYYSQNLTDKEKRSPNSPLRFNGNDYQLRLTEKNRILSTHLFGVDIDANAVEVTKLSLLLQCLQGETATDITYHQNLTKQPLLPSLENNICTGNSLVDFDYYNLTNLPETENTNQLNLFNWQIAFPNVFKQGGFDAVIGNPPYVRQELLMQYKPYFQAKYKVYHGSTDLYSYFFEKGLSILKPNGLFGIIVANKWLKANYGEPLRQYLTNYDIDQMVDFGDLQVFKGATTYTHIIIVQNTNHQNTLQVANINTLDFANLTDYVQTISKTIDKTQLSNTNWQLSSNTEQQLLNKIKQLSQPLKEFVNGEIYRGVLTGLNEAFIINEATRNNLIAQDKNSANIIKPFLAGKDLKRYQTPTANKYLIFTRRGIDILQYPAILNYLTAFKERLMPKPKDYTGDKWQGRKEGKYKWYEIQDAVDYYEKFEKPKIMWPGISAEITAFAFDEQNLYGNDNTHLIITSSKFVLGLLNSKLSKFFLKSICDTVSGGFLRLKITYVAQTPIYIIQNPTEVALLHQIVKLVDEQLAFNKQLPNEVLESAQKKLQQRIAYNDAQINQLVYELYQLSPQEIQLVEQNT